MQYGHHQLEQQGQINVKLIESYPDEDMFIYSKYNIEYSSGVFDQKATVSLNSKVVTLKKNQ